MRQKSNEPEPDSGKNAARGNPSDTPIMKQYLVAKARYPRHLLFFRIGDFFELFYDDAKTISRVLGLTLTARNKGSDPVPMAGVPAHAAEQYLARLLRMGFSVAVCDQTQDAAEAKGLVRREVTRIVTPGTVLEENLLDAKKANRLVAILPSTHAPEGPSLSDGVARFGLASVDLASGCIHIQELDGEAALRSEFARLSPTECLLPEDPMLPNGQSAPLPFHDGLLSGIAVSRLKPAAFSAREAHANVVSRFSENGRETARASALKKLAKELPLALSAAGALAGYIDETHPGGKVLLSPPQPFDPEYYLMLGDAVIRSLELTETVRSRSLEGSLLWAIDRTRTAPGSRCLREWMIRPLRDLKALNSRQDAVAALVDRTELREDLRELLKSLADLERIAARLSAGRATPRDLVALKETLELTPRLFDRISAIDTTPLLESGASVSHPNPKPIGVPKGCPAVLAAIRDCLGGFDPIRSHISQTLRDDCSNVINEGGLIQPKVDAELDRLQAISTGGKDWIAKFEAQEAERTGIGSLKVGYNRVFGYYLEISRANTKLVPKDYERRQTLTNAERYTTPELKEREAEVLGAEEKIRALEQKLFIALRESVAEAAPRLLTAGHALAELDALCSLAEIAQKRGHVRPILSNSGRVAFDQMRHPVLEETLPKGELVPNDLALCAPIRRDGSNAPPPADEKGGTKRDPQILLLTGPNMAGKSTYIRATALCVILAQMGAFVPADAAEVGLVDRIFTRVGAADDLAGGRSTFMVEMTEVAEILSACTSRSLVILDEVGRGTSTYDGVSLAWSLIEYLHEGAATPRTLFATHYHELSALEEELPRVRNASAAVKEWQGEITFLHRIVPGPSERSFGIHAARLAGLPEKVLDRARAILRSLESEGSHRVDNLTDDGAQLLSGGGEKVKSRAKRRAPTKTDGQLQLFDPEPEDIDTEVKALLDELREQSPESLTPVQALAALDKLVRKARGL
jgi:DNA mismatch repair protein MutS